MLLTGFFSSIIFSAKGRLKHPMSIYTFTTSLAAGLVRAGLEGQEWEDEQPMLRGERRQCSIYYYSAAMSKS